MREFERATTATVDAALGPPTGRYLRRLREATEEAGLPEPHVMLSRGGVATLEQAAAHPAAMLLSGPAGGAVAARIVAEPPALGFDMGGTSCDTFFLAEGGTESELTVQRQVAGLPVRLPMVDIHTVSAGGGSIAWVDSGGALRVGPQSAGADPGPACYGRGGEQPTVTDANLVLGRLPAEPIAADLTLDVDAARAALESLGVGSAEEAEGVVAVAVNAMVQALRVVSVERGGHDPAGASLLAFGGAGPLHACELATQLGATRACSACPPAACCPPSASRPPSAAATQPAHAARRGRRARARGGGACGRARRRDSARRRTCATPASRSSCWSRSRTPPSSRPSTPSTSAATATPTATAPVELVTLRAAAVAPGAEVTLTATGDVGTAAARSAGTARRWRPKCWRAPACRRARRSKGRRSSSSPRPPASSRPAGPARPTSTGS